MLKISRTETFQTDVPVSFPGDKPGQKIEGTFKATWKHIPKDRYVEILKQMQSLAEEPTRVDVEALVKFKAEVLEDVLLTVEGIADADGPLMPDEQRSFALGESHLKGSLDAMNAAVGCFMDCYSLAAGKTSRPSPKR